MDILLGLVKVGVEKLIELVPLWMRSSAEQREKIVEGARSLVGGLDKIYADADARDAANTRGAQEAIDEARKPQP